MREDTFEYDPSILRRIDLNKLMVFMTVYREANVSAAAIALGLTQSAVSNTLADLRLCFSDVLFLRWGGKMKPTERADMIAECLRPMLGILNALVERFASQDWKSSVQR